MSAGDSAGGRSERSGRTNSPTSHIPTVQHTATAASTKSVRSPRLIGREAYPIRRRIWRLWQSSKKCQVWSTSDQPLEIHAQFQQVIIPPHARLPAGDFAAWGNVVPVVRTVIYRMQQQPLVLWIGREIRVTEQRSRHR